MDYCRLSSSIFRLNSWVIRQSTLDTLHFLRLTILTQTTMLLCLCSQSMETMTIRLARVTSAAWTCCMPLVLWIILASASLWMPSSWVHCWWRRVQHVLLCMDWEQWETNDSIGMSLYLGLSQFCSCGIYHGIGLHPQNWLCFFCQKLHRILIFSCTS